MLVTTDAEGRAVPTPIWYLFRDGQFFFRTSDASIKTMNVRRDARVSICVQDERAPYKAVIVYGTAEITAADDNLGEEMPRHYLGAIGAMGYRAAARSQIEAGPEVTLRVRPERYTTFDFTPDTPWYGRIWLALKRVLPPWL